MRNEPCKVTNHAKGVAAEGAAVNALTAAGFEVLDRRYRTPAGEVDLVVASPAGLAFVEVKRRSSTRNAMEAITPRQQARIAGAAEIWLQAHPEYADRDITFDAVLVCPKSPPNHIRDAFRPAT
jgi:putative endonuclease